MDTSVGAYNFFGTANSVYIYPGNIRLGEDVLKTSLVFVFRRGLGDVLKTSSSRRKYSPYSYVFRRRLQDVFKTFHQDQHIRVDNTSSRRLQDVFKTSSRHLQDVFKMSSRRLQDVLKTSSRHLQDVFKTYYQLKVFLLTQFKTSSRRLPNVFKMYC